jgi:gentisate 1,2-dioxygenase
MAAAAPADQPVTLCYVNPTTGAPPLATMGCECQWLRPGETARTPRRTSSAVYQVIEGRGESRVGDATLAWEPGDTFVAPPWHAVEHVNLAPRPGLPLPVQRQPAVWALGFGTRPRAWAGRAVDRDGRG